MALTKVPSNLDATVATTQSASDNSTNVATTAYVTTAIANLVDGAPSTLNTLDEIAAALNDDAALNTTLTNSIATKMPLAGGTFTGNVNITKETPYLNLTDSSASRTLGVFVDDNNSVLRSSGPLLLQIGSASAITIDSSKRVGIDNGSPSAMLDVVANDNVWATEITQSNTSNGDGLIVTVGSTAAADYALSIRSDAGNTPGLNVKANGNVGINTFAPNYKLEVNGTAHVANTLTAGAVSIPSQGIILNQGFGSGVPTMTMTGTSANGRAGAILFQEQGAANTAAIYSTDGTASGNANYGGLMLATYQSDIRFATNGLASTRMIINSSGNVGIGSSIAPRSTFHVLGNNTAPPASNGAGINGLQISRTTGYSENLYLYMNSTNTGWSGSSYEGRLQSFGNNALGIGSTQNIPIVFAANDAQIARFSVGSADKYVHTSGGNSAGLGGNGCNLVLAGDDSEIRMANNFIHSDNSGNTKLTIRTGYAVASASAELSLDGGFVTMNVGSQYTEMLKATTSNVTIGQSGGAAYYLRCLTQYGEGSQGSLNSSYYHHSTDRGINYWGTRCEASGGFHTYSDENLKKEITTIDGALDSVAKMNGVTFKWKDPENRGGGDEGKQFGVIAQNMLEVDSELPSLNDDPLSPEETRESDDSFYTMDYTRLTPYFIEAIKELKTKLEAAEARITELEG